MGCILKFCLKASCLELEVRYHKYCYKQWLDCRPQEPFDLTQKLIYARFAMNKNKESNISNETKQKNNENITKIVFFFYQLLELLWK